ncbi:MAG: hypothetical protein JWO30_2426 [Fibrobacteres bacterium]|nr:hypothetical protein [Fibrobacterota bacterium]
MTVLKNIVRNFHPVILLSVLFAAVLPASAQRLAPAPVMVPQGDTGWVGSTKASFKDVAQGKIYYTLDGSLPTAKSDEYNEGKDITIDHTLTLKAIHITGGLLTSEVVTGQFIRAKLPVPTAKYGGKPAFYPAVLCTLQVVRDGITPFIRYTLDGTAPGPASPLYSAPIKITKTTTLRAFATGPGYDDGDPLQVGFTLLEPPAVPEATPKSQSFSTNTLTIKLKTATAGSFFRYTLDNAVKSLDTAHIVAGDSVSILGANVGDTTYLRAIACKTGYPNSAVMTEKYVYLPAVATPSISKPAGYFYDSVTVFLTGAKGSNIRYVTDNTVITPTSLDGSKPIILSTGATLRAQAFNPPQPPSTILNVSFVLRLTPPEFDMQSRQFTNSLDVHITSRCPKAFIYYTLDGRIPTIQTGIPLDTSGKVTIGADSTTVLKAIAVKDGIVSEPYSATYVKTAVIQKLSAPIIDPATREFEDSLDIRMFTNESDAEIHYTTDGTDPTPAGPKYSNVPIHLDSSAVLRAQSFPTRGNLQSSVVREEHYSLTPSPPIATPPATVPYANSVLVTLASHTKNGVIKYVTGSIPFDLALATTYAPGKPIVIATTTRLQALTVLSTGGITRYSSALDLTYEIYASNPSDSLLPGSSRTLTGGFVFTNASDQPITAKTHTTDIFGLVGFKDASLAVQLLPVLAGQAIKVSFTKPADRTGALYRYANGVVDFITADTQKDLTQAGDYFIGVDTMPPVISLLSAVPKAEDATLLRLSVKDNVSNPSCEIQSPGITGSKTSLKPDANGEVAVAVEMPGTDLKGLWFRASAADFYNTGRLPKDAAGKLYVSQLWNRLNTPSVLALGRTNSAWDMAGFPVSAAEPLTWKQVRQDNEGVSLDAAVWMDAIQDYVYLEDTSSIRPGMAFWMGSRSALSSVGLTGFRAGESETDGTYRMVIHPGWNQVTSPSMDRVYWPVTTAASKSPLVYLKAPYRYLPEADDYVQCDSLEPWRGYFVNYFGSRDTIVTLFTDASKRPAPKTAAAPARGGNRSVDLNLDIGRTMPLNLAAQTDAQDGIGAEDEPDMPALKRNFAAWSQRGRRHLITDVIHFTAGEPLRWNIVVADSGSRVNGTVGSGKLRVLEGTLPPGYQAWAVSGTRGMKFRLEAGTEMPLSGMAGDTLSVYAGPLEKLAGISEFAHAVMSVDKFACNLERGPNGRTLRLALPAAANVDVSVWAPSGKLLATLHPGRLAPGIYRLPFAADRGNAGENPRMGFLRIRLDGENGFRESSQKVFW